MISFPVYVHDFVDFGICGWISYQAIISHHDYPWNRLRSCGVGKYFGNSFSFHVGKSSLFMQRIFEKQL